jgi:hypothetical protein
LRRDERDTFSNHEKISGNAPDPGPTLCNFAAWLLRGSEILCDLNEKAGIFRVKPQAWHDPIRLAVASSVAMPYDRFEARGAPRGGKMGLCN